MAGEAQRQLLGIEDPLPCHVGHRDFRGGDHVEVGAFDPELVVGKLRELPGPAQYLGSDEIGDVDLPVAVLAGMHVEHELDQRAVQPCEPPVQGDEPAPGELRRQLEVDAAEGDTQVGVVLRLEVETRRLADPAFLAVVVFAPAFRHAGVGEVGDLQGDALQLRLKLRQPALRGFQRVAEPGHLRKQRLDVLAAGLRPPDRLRAGVTLVLQLLGALLNFLALVFEPGDTGGVELEPPGRQPGRRRFEITPEKCRIEHVDVFPAPAPDPAGPGPGDDG